MSKIGRDYFRRKWGTIFDLKLYPRNVNLFRELTPHQEKDLINENILIKSIKYIDNLLEYEILSSRSY